MELCGAHGMLLQFAPEAAKKNKNVVLAAVKRHGLALQFSVPDEKQDPVNSLRCDDEVVRAAVAEDGDALQKSPAVWIERVIVSNCGRSKIAPVHESYMCPFEGK